VNKQVLLNPISPFAKMLKIVGFRSFVERTILYKIWYRTKLQLLPKSCCHVKRFSVKKSIFQKSRFRKNENSEVLSKDGKKSNSTFCSTSWCNSKRSNLQFRITKMKIQNCVEKLSPRNKFLGLLKINSLLSNETRHKISKSIFGKSTKF
jgi:hypothetical protein